MLVLTANKPLPSLARMSTRVESCIRIFRFTILKVKDNKTSKLLEILRLETQVIIIEMIIIQFHDKFKIYLIFKLKSQAGIKNDQK